MKYIEKYMAEVLKIKALGKVTLSPCSHGEETGNSIVIDGKDTGIDVWWIDYATWLEEKARFVFAKIEDSDLTLEK